eukprot:TRINITY_DN2377_c0_g1_i3.p1 TRINITY_DN2377_c0_g1~~TRINITY_DN2377_c0_g1_i3.p1  ORF type:complete len:574 (-),score=119.93 TRINITY_DN2377_c0_g1_i3:11-1672(-)
MCIRDSHGDIRPRTILLTDEGKVKLYDEQLVKGPSNGFKDYTYYSPQALESFSKPNYTYDLFKSDVFSFGMCLLEVCSIDDVHNLCYDLRTRTLNYQMIDQLLEHVRLNYPTKLFALLVGMLQFEESQRITWSVVIDYLTGKVMLPNPTPISANTQQNTSTTPSRGRVTYATNANERPSSHTPTRDVLLQQDSSNQANQNRSLRRVDSGGNFMQPSPIQMGTHFQRQQPGQTLTGVSSQQNLRCPPDPRTFNPNLTMTPKTSAANLPPVMHMGQAPPNMTPQMSHHPDARTNTPLNGYQPMSLPPNPTSVPQNYMMGLANYNSNERLPREDPALQQTKGGEKPGFSPISRGYSTNKGLMPVGKTGETFPDPRNPQGLSPMLPRRNNEVLKAMGGGNDLYPTYSGMDERHPNYSTNDGMKRAASTSIPQQQPLPQQKGGSKIAVIQKLSSPGNTVRITSQFASPPVTNVSKKNVGPNHGQPSSYYYPPSPNLAMPIHDQNVLRSNQNVHNAGKHFPPGQQMPPQMDMRGDKTQQLRRPPHPYSSRKGSIYPINQ